MADSSPNAKDRKSNNTPAPFRVKDDAAQQERLLTLGTLAGTIAHDFNNLLTTIQGSADMALRDLENPVLTARLLRNILLASRQSRELVDQIQSYNRHQTVTVEPVDLKSVLNTADELIRARASADIEISFSASEEPAFTKANRSQLLQVILNICTNAIQAMREDGGHIFVQLDRDEQAPGGRVLRLVIRDSGKGMSPELIEHIFDPYFTTKAIGLGTGLGLAVVKSVIDQYDGTIEVDTKMDEGTTFTLHLHETSERLEEGNPKKRGGSAEHAEGEKKRAVLLVDDESFMRGLGMDMLHSLGFRVSVACDGKQAMQLLERKPDYFDLIISDSRMPEVTGPELAAYAREKYPKIPFILITAFSEPSTERHLKKIGVASILKKPFLIDDLDSAVGDAFASTK